MSDQLLRWANLLLTLPVLLFSSGPFFRAAWSDLKNARVSMDLPVALGIGLTFAVSTAAVMDPAGMWGNELYFDSLTMLVFFLLTGRWLELRLKQEVAGQMEFGVGLLPVSAEVVSKTGATDTVPIDSLQVGDVIRVRTGETFAADGVVIFGLSEVDESVLTGESLPVAKAAGENVFAGTTNLSSPLEVRLTRLDAETRLGQMNRLMQCSLHTKPKIVQLADRVAKPFLLVVLMLAISAILFWWPTDPQRGILAAIAILVVTCPCALALAAPTAFLSSASCLAQHGLLVRDLTALERLDRVDHFVFDKTGTLTQSALSVSSAQALNGHSIEHVLAQAELLAQQSVHPVSMAVSQFVAGKLPTLTFGQIVSNVEEFAGFGVQAKIALKNEKPIICKLGSSRFCEVKEIRGDKRRVVYLSEDDTLIGAFYLDEKLRPDAGSTMISLEKLLHKTNPSLKSHLSIMSGDSENSVDSISRELQWDKARDQVKAECSASDKLAGLEHLRADGMHVAMVGDGINDSPVLAAADVSFAPVQGAALANIKADFVLTFNTLAPIAFAKRQATYTMTIVRQNLSWSIAYNLCCVPLALAGYLTPWMAGLGMAASSVLVLINSLRLKRIKG